MAQYQVGNGESWMSIAGKLYGGDQTQFGNIMQANPGKLMLHPGDIIEVPDAPGQVGDLTGLINYLKSIPFGPNGGNMWSGYGPGGGAAGTPGSSANSPAGGGGRNADGTPANGPALNGPNPTLPAGYHGVGSGGLRTPGSVADPSASSQFGGALPTGQPGAGVPASGPGFDALANTPATGGQTYLPLVGNTQPLVPGLASTPHRPGSPLGPMGGGRNPGMNMTVQESYDQWQNNAFAPLPPPPTGYGAPDNPYGWLGDAFGMGQPQQTPTRLPGSPFKTPTPTATRVPTNTPKPKVQPTNASKSK